MDRCACGKPKSRKSSGCLACYQAKRQTWATCPNCDGQFQVRVAGARKFCSTICARTFPLKGQSRPVPWATCDECESPYVKRGKGLTCGPTCSQARAIRLREERIVVAHARRDERHARPLGCARCERTFTRSNGMGRNPLYCEECKPVVYQEHKSGARTRRRLRLKGVECEVFEKQEIFERDGWVCKRCLVPVLRGGDTNDDRYPNLDHVKPISKGGSHTRWNVQLLCRKCNLDKSDSYDYLNDERTRDEMILSWVRLKVAS